VRFNAPSDLARLFRATLASVQRHLLKVIGQAPDRLRFEMPLETFRSGDVRVA